MTARSFTVTANGGILRVLRTECEVFPAFDPQATGPHPACHKFHAIWDTGATGTVITQAVVDACDLKPTGVVQVHGVQGAHLAKTYLINLRLVNGVAFAGVRVTEGILPGGARGDLLIGMDIITQGDFSITNHGAKTVFSFRIPSLRHVDFVKDHNEEIQRQQALANAAARSAVGRGYRRNKKGR